MDNSVLLGSPAVGGVAGGVSGAQVSVVEQPLHVRLAKETELHGRILRELTDRARMGRDHIAKRVDRWREVDYHMHLYVDLEAAAKMGDGTEDPYAREMPWGRVISIPSTYATLWTRFVMCLSVLTSRDPLVHLKPRGDEDWRAARLMEAMLRYDFEQMRSLLLLFQVVQNVERYGQAWVHDWWEEEEGWGLQFPPRLPIEALRFLPQSMRRAVEDPYRVWQVKREYCRAEALDVYSALPDPRVSALDPQAGEFFGYTFSRHFMEIAARAIGKAERGLYFNVEHLRRLAETRDENLSGRGVVGDYETSMQVGSEPGFLKLTTMEWRLVPRQYGLGDGEKPEVWRFTFGGDQVIIRAHAVPYVHGQLSVSAAQSHPDMHAAWAPGSGELSDGFQRFISFMVNSHIQELMHGLYGAHLLDPALIELGDVENPGIGRNVRVTALGSELLQAGADARAWFVPAPQTSHTAGNMQLAGSLYDWEQRMLSIPDPAQAVPLPTKRTLGEIQTMMASSNQRVTMLAKMIDETCIRTLAERMVANRQQFTRGPQLVRIAGDVAERFGGMREIEVRRSDLWGNFDYVPHTATMPMDPARAADVWLEVVKLASSVPGIAQQLDVMPLIEEIARVMGVPQLTQFFKQSGQMPNLPVGVVPDEVMARRVQAGNAVPLGQAMAAGGRLG